ncbi:MAG: hypothetical protein BGO59_20065 [Spirosoma sp. 48-14]|nr:MAG: hypothetical protein BGO59_20065 [Spirosoma sp. 48-14]
MLVLGGFRPVTGRACPTQSAVPCTCCCSAGHSTNAENRSESAASCASEACSSTVNPADVSVRVSVAPAQDVLNDQPSLVLVYHQWLRSLLAASHDAGMRPSHSYDFPPFERDVFLRLRTLLI